MLRPNPKSLVLFKQFRYKYLINQTYSTFKSRDDEQLNQALLGRLKNLAIKDETKIVPKIVRDSDLAYENNQQLTFKRITKLIELYIKDPLHWNASVLSRIFKLPEEQCYYVVNYVRPFVYYANKSMDEPQQMVKNPVVIDVARLQKDEKYLVHIRGLTFIKPGQMKLNIFAIPDPLTQDVSNLKSKIIK